MTTRLTVVVLIVALLQACASPRVVRLETGQGAPLELRQPTVRPVKVEAEAFEESLSRLILNSSLTLRTPQERGWVRATYASNNEDTRWQRLMSKSFGGICEPGQRQENCLSLLDDVMGLSPWDKLGVALSLSLAPLKESIAQAVQDTLAPQIFYTVIATGLITWAILATNPEPVFTKGAALVSMLLLIYLGADTFLDVVDASRELKEATDRATTWKELEDASQRFAHRIGPEVARVFVLAVTVALSYGMTGGAAFLASRLSALPSFSEVATAGASRLGVTPASLGQASAVAVVGSTIVISLPATAVAVVAQSVETGVPEGDSLTGLRSWGSFSSLKRTLGPAGAGKQWHHIVEQTEGNLQRFGPQALHNTENVIAIDEGIHRRISAYYSSKDPSFTGSQTVREWLRGQSLQAQREFGLKILRDYGAVQ